MNHREERSHSHYCSFLSLAGWAGLQNSVSFLCLLTQSDISSVPFSCKVAGIEGVSPNHCLSSLSVCQHPLGL